MSLNKMFLKQHIQSRQLSKPTQKWVLNKHRFASHAIFKKAFILALGFFSAHTALGACPVTKYITQVDKVNSKQNKYGSTIYFCKQDFSTSQLTFSPTDQQLLSGGNQVVSMGNAPPSIQSFPASNTIDLSGFTPSQLNLNTLSANFPNSGGKYEEQNLFNFYTLIKYEGRGKIGTCYNFGENNQFDLIRNYLRNNATIFQANNNSGLPAKFGERLDTGNDLAIIRDVTVGHNSQNGQSIKADITFYHANAGQTGQWFSTTFGRRFCWVGVSTRMDIKTDTNPPKFSGDYTVDVGVLTQ